MLPYVLSPSDTIITYTNDTLPRSKNHNYELRLQKIKEISQEVEQLASNMNANRIGSRSPDVGLRLSAAAIDSMPTITLAFVPKLDIGIVKVGDDQALRILRGDATTAFVDSSAENLHDNLVDESGY
jgi:hypothetical protein